MFDRFRFSTSSSVLCAVPHRLLVLPLLLSWILFGGALLYGQEQPAAVSALSPIVTDRPSVTDSSIVVPNGYLQFENGFTATGDQGQNSFDFPETLVRFGLTSKTELRFSVPDYYQNFNVGNGFGSGWGDLSLGVKQQLLTTSGGLDAALVVSLSFPTGANMESSHGYDPAVQLPWSHPISKSWTAAGMFSLLWPTEDGQHDLTGQASFLVDWQITSPWDVFVEYAGEFPERGGSQNLLHVGTTFEIRSNQQLDFHFGFGLSPAAVDHFIGFGYSFRFQAIHHGPHGGS
jgi:Putative MetA-pathway of phenol degradation